MREIKFRAWDKRNNKFVLGDTFSINRNGKIDAVTWKDWEYSEDPDDFILLQFTGLKDKNGKEIYEKDIVKYYERIISYTNEQQEIMGEEGAEINDVMLVEWDIEGADFQMRRKEIRGFNARGLYQIEIIGNYYENPELLTSQ